jgi:hypothetical protein
MYFLNRYVNRMKPENQCGNSESTQIRQMDANDGPDGPSSTPGSNYRIERGGIRSHCSHNVMNQLEVRENARSAHSLFRIGSFSTV